MLKSCLRHPWFTGVATALVAAAAVYMTSGEPGSSTNKNKPSRDRTKARRSKPSGLINEGNTCFINAVLQALASCRAFTFWMATVVQEQQDHTNDLRTLSSLHTTITVVNNQHPEIQADIYNTRQLVQSLEKHGWILRSDEQDCHELLNVLFTTVDEEIVKNGKNRAAVGISVSEPSNGFHHQGSAVGITSPFRGLLASQLCCLTCGHKAAVRYDAFECLSIPLPKLDIKNAFTLLSVESLLKSFLAAETVSDVVCDSCSAKNGTKSVFVKQLSLGKLPQCLCLHIQRCDWTTGQLTKRQDLVKFNEELNVSKFMYTRRLTGDFAAVNYRLRAVVEHLGVADSGHFVTFRQNAVTDDRIKWFYASDTCVRSSNVNEVLKSSPYMLFYERVYSNV